LELEHIQQLSRHNSIDYSVKIKAARDFKRNIIQSHKNVLRMAQILDLKKLTVELEKDIDFYENYDPKNLIDTFFTSIKEQGDEINANFTNYRELEQNLKQEYKEGWISKETYLAKLDELKKEYY
ncbi:hypothetical protein, partial [[Eubacterium] cellulosolvens]